MNKIDELQDFINENIPLAAKSGFRIEECTAHIVRVSADLKENRNPHNSVFGGSISALMILAGWLMARETAETMAPGSSIVVMNQKVDFLKPVRGDFEAAALKPSDENRKSLSLKLDSKGTGTIEICAELREVGNEEICAAFSGFFHVRKQ